MTPEEQISLAMQELGRNVPALEVLHALDQCAHSEMDAVTHARWQLARGVALNRMRWFKEALGELVDARRALSSAGQSHHASEAWRQIGIVWTWRGAGAEAAFALLRSVADAAMAGSTSAMALTLFDFARVQIEIGRFGDGVEVIETALRLGGSSIDTVERHRALVNLLQALSAQGRDSEFAARIDALEPQAMSPRLQHLIAIERFRVALRASDAVAAQQTLNDIAQKLPEDEGSFERIEYLAACSEWCVAQRTFAAALESIETVLKRCAADKLFPREVEARVMKAKALDGLGRRDEAADALVAALRCALGAGLLGHCDRIRQMLAERNELGRESLVTAGDPKVVGRVDVRFVRRNLLGQGGVGRVERAYDLETGLEVALKRIELSKVIDPDRRRSLQESAHREVLATARVQHPAIVPMVGLFLEPGGDAYVASEFIHGPTLRKAMESPTLHNNWSWLAVRLSHALSALHNAGLTFCDLKPENIIIRENTGPVLIDFGAAVFRAFHRDFGASAFTPAYASPEQLANASVGPPSDIFALGVILHEIVCGEPPAPVSELPFGFGDARRRREIHAALQNRGLGSGHADVICDCLAAEPHIRPLASKLAGAFS